MKKRRVGISIAVVVLIWVLAPLITLPWAKAAILSALERNLGRRIEAQAVRLHVFPLPGVELDQVSLAEDPAFGLEDMVEADSATANVSLWALLHGELVFSRIHLQDASINLVRNRSGHWNISALLQRTAEGAAGGGSGRGAPARFPYLDWTDTRINFKFDQIKSRFYLGQVSGSLARERSDWRLQASFVPARSDLNLSNTGEVAVDGRWRAPAGSLQQAPFALAVHIRNSYLAGSSALFAGHDAGVHGIVNAALRVAGSGESFAITGTVTAHSLRRWDLLPPPAQVSAAVDAVYTPGTDQLRVIGIGDPGWQHFRLQGTIQGLFARPQAQLELQLHDFAAAHLLPLALALKAHLPADLAASGQLNGEAEVDWKAGEGVPQGRGAFRLQQVRLSSQGHQLELAQAQLEWGRQGLRLLPATARFRGAQAPGTLQLEARADAHGFRVEMDGAAVDESELRALAALAGLETPWPAHLGGTEKLALRLGGAWTQTSGAHWSGSADFESARFQPPGSAGVLLQPLRLQWGGSAPLRAEFSLAQLPVAGRLQWNPRTGATFSLSGERLVPSARVWALLHPAPGDLMQRMFGSVLGQAAPPAWLENLHAQGTIQLRRLEWHGVDTGLQMQMKVAPGGWRAPHLQLDLGGGFFQGSGSIDKGHYQIQGSVEAARPVPIGSVIATTPYAGRLRGLLSGSIEMSRPLSGGGWGPTAADGDFRIREGRLATSAGAWPFQNCAGKLRLRQGRARISELVCRAHGQVFRGGGEVQFGSGGALRYALTLHHERQVLNLRSPSAR